jgi:hypothetical protein
MKRSIFALSALLLAIPAYAAPVYHDCRPSEDIVNGRTVHKTICQNENGDWVEKKPAPRPVSLLPIQQANPVKKPVYHDCRDSQDIVNGREVWKTVCQNEKGDWVERP